jgi:putative methionine-R-sulfoxide reductase with GAF domain
MSRCVIDNETEVVQDLVKTVGKIARKSNDFSEISTKISKQTNEAFTDTDIDSCSFILGYN